MDRKKFKQLRPGQKLQWLFQYYGLTAAVVIVAIVVGAVFLRSVFGPEDDYAIRVLILDDRQSADICQLFSQELGDILSGPCDITSYLKIDADQARAFAVRLSVDDLDLIIAPEDEIDQLAQNGYLRRAVKLEEDSYYYTITRGGSPLEEQALYIGEPFRSRNTDSIPAAIEYFTGKSK